MGDIVNEYSDPIQTPHDGYVRLGIRSHGKGTFYSYVKPGQELGTAQMHKVATDKLIVNITFAWEHAVAVTDENDAEKLVSHRFPQFSLSEIICPKFLHYLILDGRFRHHLWLSSPGGAGRNRVLKIPEMLEYKMQIPSVDEQRQIAYTLCRLDNLITLHQRKYDKIVNVKKAMLEKMFPKDGSDVPEIRFKGFTEAWEQRKFFDCIERIIDFRGRTPKKLGMDWSESGYLALSAINVKDGYIDLTQDVHYGNQELYDKWMIGNELHKGQVLFTTEAPMGNVAQVPDNRQYILSQRTIAFNVRQGKIAENFLATILRSPSVSFALTSLASGGTAKGVSQSSLSKLDIIIPKNLDEQDSISNIFLELTNLITLHQRKCIFHLFGGNYAEYYK